MASFGCEDITEMSNPHCISNPNGQFLQIQAPSSKRPMEQSRLQYSIHKCSSFSSTYYPENILEDKPQDQTSRWSSDSNTPPQYLTLKLNRTSIVQRITFGKFEKTHVCNLKKFKIYGGVSEETLVELLEGGLKNDSNPESFKLKHKIEGYYFPCRYIQIVPLQSWGPSFNFSIWYVELSGTDEYDIVDPAINRLNEYREREAIRVCLKHLREHNYLDAFESLQKKTRVQLEHPLLTELYRTLVVHGDYVATEQFLENSINQNLFQDYLSRQDYRTSWKLICPDDATSILRPGMRGGHQMCIDSVSETIYLFGGWDGHQDLADFWSFHIPTAQWTLLSANTESEGGPGPRSCHKICLDQEHRQIFTLGRYIDSNCRPHRNLLKSDFYVYDIESNKWTLITEDTGAMGGPQLIFDHQMCIDTTKRVLYVFGGRILTGPNVTETLSLNSDLLAFVVNNDNGEEVAANNILHLNRSAQQQGNDGNGSDSQNIHPQFSAHRDVGMQVIVGDPEGDPAVAAAAPLPAPPTSGRSANRQGNEHGRGRNDNGGDNGQTSSAISELLYSGLYSYHIPTNTWSLLRCDVACPLTSRGSIRSRVGHSMLFHQTLRKLFVFGGQRSKQYLNDFFAYNVDTDEIEMLSVGHKDKLSNSSYVPTTGFTQRATIDHDLHEIYIFSGLSKDKDSRHENVQNSFWVFDIIRKSWSCIYKNDVANNDGGNWKNQQSEPCPRFAHQLVYDSANKVHYLFGGNPGRAKDPKLRLNDFWRLQLIRPSQEDLLRQCKLLIRKLRFEELTVRDPPNALVYLQTHLSEIIDHSDTLQTQEFQRLTLLLFEREEKRRHFIPETSPSSEGSYLESRTNEDEVILRRSQLFDKLARFFPENMTQPKTNLIDILPL